MADQVLTGIFVIVSCFLSHMWGYFRGKVAGIEWVEKHFREIYGEDEE